MISRIHQINNYKSRYDLSDLFTMLNLNQELLDKSLSDLYELNAELKTALLKFKKRKIKSNKDNVKQLVKATKTSYLDFEKIITDTGFVESFKKLIDPNAFIELVNKIGHFRVAERLHRDSLIETFDIINADKKLMVRLHRELLKLNLNYKQANYLVNSIRNNDENAYYNVCSLIEKRFIELPFLMIKTDCEEAAIGCLKSGKYLTGTHSNFNLYHTQINFPEIYLIKVAVSKAFNQI